jgi:hypothetical protein
VVRAFAQLGPTQSKKIKIKKQKNKKIKKVEKIKKMCMYE